MLIQDRPVCFFDLESTGTDVAKDRIVEICILRREVDGRETLLSTLVNPEQPIPAEATEVHRIGDEDVRDAPTFKAIAPRVLEILTGADLAGFNIAGFDVPMLAAELDRAGVQRPRVQRRILDAFLVFKRREPHSLSSAVRRYCGRELGDGAHRAEVDVRATAEVLDRQVEAYADLPKDAAALATWLSTPDPRHVDRDGKFRWAGTEAVFAFAKHQGRPLRDVARSDRGYLQWMLGGTFPPDVKEIVRGARGPVPGSPHPALRRSGVTRWTSPASATAAGSAARCASRAR